MDVTFRIANTIRYGEVVKDNPRTVWVRTYKDKETVIVKRHKVKHSVKF